MNKLELRAHYDRELQPIKEINTVESWTKNNLDNTWKTQHSLQLSRFGFFILKKYCKSKNINMLSIIIKNGRNIGELLMIANTMNVPYYIAETHLSNKLVIHTIESDRSTMLIMNDGNVPHWASMFRDS